MAGMLAENVWKGVVRQARWEDALRSGEEVFKLDVRGKALFEVLKYLGISDISYNQPKGQRYPTENPWS